MAGWVARSLDDLHADIPLPPNEVISLGRHPDTGITERSVSKIHTLLKYQPEKRLVLCKQLGRNSATVNGEELKTGMKARIAVNSTIDLLLHQRYRYSIVKAGGKIKSVDRANGTLPTSSSSSSSSSPAGGSLSEGMRKFLLGKMDVENCTGSPWRTSRDLIVKETPGGRKIAGFDLDHTLITTKSGRVFPRDEHDWTVAWPHKVPGKLRELVNDGYKIVIFTNQNGIQAGKITVEEFTSKTDRVIRELGVPVQVMAAPRRTVTRKPAPGMWVAFEQNFNDSQPIDYSQSFYVGDAAGRPVGGARKRKDFSSSDREFARNVGLKFYTPEQYFLGESGADNFTWSSFDPTQCGKSDTDSYTSSKQEMVILVGFPGSGKSTFAREKLPTYTAVSLDIDGSVGKCVTRAKAALAEGRSVVVDNTSPDLASRERFVAIAQSAGVDVRCLVMETSLQHAKHNNRFRHLVTPDSPTVPDVAYNTYKSRYAEPTTAEGFSAVETVHFSPHFRDAVHRELYSMFLD